MRTGQDGEIQNHREQRSTRRGLGGESGVLWFSISLMFESVHGSSITPSDLSTKFINLMSTSLKSMAALPLDWAVECIDFEAQYYHP
jgi:hypothetical protein